MIEAIEIGNTTDDQLTVTLRGEAAQVMKALVNGLSREALLQIQDALTAELNRRNPPPAPPEET